MVADWPHGDPRGSGAVEHTAKPKPSKPGAVGGGPPSNPVLSCLRTNLLLLMTMLFVLGGVLLGLGMSNAGGVTMLGPSRLAAFAFPGELLLRMLRMVILPLVVCSLISSTASMDPGVLGHLGCWALLFFLFSTLIGCMIGISLAVALQPGAALAEAQNDTGGSPSAPQGSGKSVLDSILDLLRNVFPSNLVTATFSSYATYYEDRDFYGTTMKVPVGHQVEGMNILGLVVFSMAFGVCLRKLGRNGEILIHFFSSFNNATMEMVSWIVWFTPVGVLFLVASKVMEMEDMNKLFSSVGKYVLCIMLGHGIHGLLVLPFLYFILTRKNPYRFLWGIVTALAMAFATCSSSATLPLTMQCVERNGISKNICRFILPIGATVNMDGAALFQCVAAVFIAQANQRPLDIVMIITILITATASSVGTAGVPAGGVLTLAIILEAVNLPVDLSLILAVDWLVDRTCTVINVEGDAFGAGVLQHLVDRGKASSGSVPQLLQVKSDSSVAAMPIFRHYSRPSKDIDTSKKSLGM
ncbi:Neutral amino acid transporter B(0) [Myotis brandtii]|uniref:Amino acid transporter n=1 Tax=Myotis brandtii TaxID=109478 RepID=S7MN20_MYOBR|nr:PREDICTED: neutral amino acid transporter B(0) [Myotis brandtii]EPQ05709.1 Neutral amino acid transporter B(0) [Myotis brandtii]